MCLIINPVRSAVQYYDGVLKNKFACKNQLVTVKSVKQIQFTEKLVVFHSVTLQGQQADADDWRNLAW